MGYLLDRYKDIMNAMKNTNWKYHCHHAQAANQYKYTDTIDTMSQFGFLIFIC